MLSGVDVDEHLERLANSHGFRNGGRGIRHREEGVADAHHRASGRREQAAASSRAGRTSARCLSAKADAS